MPSINSYDLIKQLIDNNGHYEDDPVPLMISKYTNNWGKTTYHLAYSIDDINALYSSPFCHNIKELWIKEPSNDRE